MPESKADPFYDIKCDDHYHSVEVKRNSVIIFQLGVQSTLRISRMEIVKQQAQRLLQWARAASLNVYPAVLVLDRDESLSTVSVKYMRDQGWVRESELLDSQACAGRLAERLAYYTDKDPVEIKEGMERQVAAQKYEKGLES